MKFKKSVKLGLNKVTISNLGNGNMRAVRGGLADDNNDPVAGTVNYTNCNLCSIPWCGTLAIEKSCAGPSCAGSCWQTCNDSCAVPPMACAAIDDDIAID